MRLYNSLLLELLHSSASLVDGVSVLHIATCSTASCLGHFSKSKVVEKISRWINCELSVDFLSVAVGVGNLPNAPLDKKRN